MAKCRLFEKIQALVTSRQEVRQIRLDDQSPLAGRPPGMLAILSCRASTDRDAYGAAGNRPRNASRRDVCASHR